VARDITAGSMPTGVGPSCGHPRSREPPPTPLCESRPARTRSARLRAQKVRCSAQTEHRRAKVGRSRSSWPQVWSRAGGVSSPIGGPRHTALAVPAPAAATNPDGTAAPSRGVRQIQLMCPLR
jgi:hypothetical protein